MTQSSIKLTKKLWKISYLAYLGLCGCAHWPDTSNRVYVLGSLHGYMLEQPNYSLKEFVAAITYFRPDLILTEVRPEAPGPLEGSIDGGIEQSIVYAYGQEKSIPVIPVDWFTDEFIAGLAREEDPTEVAPLSAIYKKKIREASFFELQSDKTQALVKQIYDLTEKHGNTLSRTRNEHICKNIDKALSGKHDLRVLVVFGLDHKYFLNEYLRNELSKTEDFIAPEDFKNFKPSDELRTAAIANVVSTENLLRTRLEQGFYQGEMLKRLENKLKEFPLWRAKLEKL